jgi:chaperonin GroEL
LRTITDQYETEKLERRIAQLGGAMARIRVGGGSEAEMGNRVELVESALTSMRATLAEGMVPGAGVAFLSAATAVNDLCLEGDQATGAAIVRRALEEPLRQIVANCGQNSAVVLSTVKRLQAESGQEFVGYDALRGEYCNLLERGIVDPCKTVRIALANAASCAMMLLTTEVIATGLQGM